MAVTAPSYIQKSIKQPFPSDPDNVSLLWNKNASFGTYLYSSGSKYRDLEQWAGRPILFCTPRWEPALATENARKTQWEELKVEWLLNNDGRNYGGGGGGGGSLAVGEACKAIFWPSQGFDSSQFSAGRALISASVVIHCQWPHSSCFHSFWCQCSFCMNPHKRGEWKNNSGPENYFVLQGFCINWTKALHQKPKEKGSTLKVYLISVQKLLPA